MHDGVFLLKGKEILNGSLVPGVAQQRALCITEPWVFQRKEGSVFLPQADGETGAATSEPHGPYRFLNDQFTRKPRRFNNNPLTDFSLTLQIPPGSGNMTPVFTRVDCSSRCQEHPLSEKHPLASFRSVIRKLCDQSRP